MNKYKEAFRISKINFEKFKSESKEEVGLVLFPFFFFQEIINQKWSLIVSLISPIIIFFYFFPFLLLFLIPTIILLFIPFESKKEELIKKWYIKEDFLKNVSIKNFLKLLVEDSTYKKKDEEQELQEDRSVKEEISEEDFFNQQKIEAEKRERDKREERLKEIQDRKIQEEKENKSVTSKSIFDDYESVTNLFHKK